MSKKKRIRRDIEKSYRMGRYWEFLRLLESEGRTSEKVPERKEAWKALIKQALRLEGSFDEFCREVGTLRSLPDDPDLRFLMRLRGFIDGRKKADEVLELKELTPGAERLMAKFALFASSTLRQEKQRDLLEKFAKEPDKITRRHFEQAAGSISAAALSDSVRKLGELIASARGLNGKAAAARGWDGINFRRLARLDRMLCTGTARMPSALREILLHPFAHNIAVMCRRLASDATGNRVAQLVVALPFLLDKLAGDKLSIIKEKLPGNRGEWMESGGLDALRRKVEGLSIEEKLTLLKGMRLCIDAGPSEDRLGGADLDLFEDDEDYEPDESGLSEEDSESYDLARKVLFLHKSILKDISSRLQGLSFREKKELVRIMEPVLLHDLDFFICNIEDTEEVLGLLDAAIRAGCAGTRMGLLALLAGSCYRNGDLRRRAEKFLDESAAPTRQEMEWLARDFCEFYYPFARSLKPLLIRYKNDESLMALFAVELCSIMETAMFESAVLCSPVSPSGALSAKMCREAEILSMELKGLSEYKVFDPVRHYLRCYSDGRPTTGNHLCWLNAYHSFFGEAVWDFATANLKRDKEALGMRMFLPMESFEKFYTDRLEAFLLFIKEHVEELAALSPDRLDPLFGLLLRYTEVLPDHHSLFIRLEKLFALRVEAGEKALRPLMNKIRQSLINLAKGKGRARKPAKRRP